MRIAPAAVLAAACTVLPVSAQSLRPGLWEITQRMQGNPQMNQAMAEMHKQMAAMPPEQRRQMEAMMARQGVQMGGPAAGGGMTSRICMSKEMAERGDVAPADKGTCKTTSQPRSGATWRMSYVCTNPPSSGEGEVTVSSPEAYTMKMTSTTQAGGRTEKMTMDASGKWLAADCGALRPPQRP